MATIKKSKVIAVPIPDTGLLNNCWRNCTKRRHQDGTAPRVLFEDLEIEFTSIDWQVEPLRDQNDPGRVSIENRKIYR